MAKYNLAHAHVIVDPEISQRVAMLTGSCDCYSPATEENIWLMIGCGTEELSPEESGSILYEDEDWDDESEDDIEPTTSELVAIERDEPRAA